MDIIKKLETSQYASTPAQIQQLTAEVGRGVTASLTYFRCLLVEARVMLGRGRSTNAKQIAAINKAHAKFYPAVLRGIGNDSMEPGEKHRRATFARSAASDIRGGVRAGRDIRAVDVATVTRKDMRPPSGVKRGNRFDRALERGTSTIIAAVTREVKRDQDLAVKQLRAVVEALGEELQRIEKAALPSLTVVSGKMRPAAQHAATARH